MSITYAIGDIHGCFAQLSALSTLCLNDAGLEPSQFIFLGDYIDRGPHCAKVIDFLMNLQAAAPDRVTCLMGNHEDLLLSAVDDPKNEQRWLRNGGTRTLRSYGASKSTDLPAYHLSWLETLPKFHDDGVRFFVHAGVHPDRPLDQQDEYDLLYIREPFLSSTKDFGRYIVHGHTPIADGSPDQRLNRLNIDTGAVFGRRLTAAVFTDEATLPKRFIFSD